MTTTDYEPALSDLLLAEADRLGEQGAYNPAFLQGIRYAAAHLVADDLEAAHDAQVRRKALGEAGEPALHTGPGTQGPRLRCFCGGEHITGSCLQGAGESS